MEATSGSRCLSQPTKVAITVAIANLGFLPFATVAGILGYLKAPTLTPLPQSDWPAGLAEVLNVGAGPKPTAE